MKKSLLKVLGAGYLCMACMFLFGANAQAYIDPSVATYAIQAIAGIAIAVGAAVGALLSNYFNEKALWFVVITLTFGVIMFIIDGKRGEI